MEIEEEAFSEDKDHFSEYECKGERERAYTMSTVLSIMETPRHL